MIAETPMNQASTRSHCIFTIHITSREPGSATIRRSKLHLVDLAGYGAPYHVCIVQSACLFQTLVSKEAFTFFCAFASGF